VTSALNLNRDQPLPAVRPQAHGLGTVGPEWVLFAACLALLALGAYGPAVVQSSHYHVFADQRSLFGVPNMMDACSNLAFAGFGLVGIWRTGCLPRSAISPAQRKLVALFFFGLLVTAACSAWYHLQPEDGTLAIDRYGMTIAFAGLLGLAAATRVSDRAGQWLTFALLACGAWSIHTWIASANVLPWAVLQFGGLTLMLGLALLAPRVGALPVPWITVIIIYALAKVLEQSDAQVYHLTGDLISGHTLKHIVASFAALPVLRAMSRASPAIESPARSAALPAKR
jgi:hypothetical protein